MYLTTATIWQSRYVPCGEFFPSQARTVKFDLLSSALKGEPMNTFAQRGPDDDDDDEDDEELENDDLGEDDEDEDEQ